MRKIKTWVLIADGAHARIVVNEGPGRGINREPVREFEGPNLPAREIMADKPGRTFDSAGYGRHAKELPTDPKEHEQHVFHRTIARFLEEEANRGAYDRLVIVAPPRALGDLRAVLPPAVRAKVTGELNKDLTKVPVHDLPDHLGTVMAV